MIMLNESFQKLYIQVSLQNFSYCVKNQVNNQVIQFKSFALDPYKTIEQQLDVFFDKEEALQAGFQDVLVLHRSEEHTSELQSRENLVCRLLLEKKNSRDCVPPS